MNAQDAKCPTTGIMTMMTDEHCGSYTHVILNQNFVPNTPKSIFANVDIQHAPSMKYLKTHFFLRTRTT